MLVHSAVTEPIIAADRQTFKTDFDRQCFAFTHRLATSPLFEFERLLTLAKDMAQNPDDVYYDAGDVGIGQRWDDVPVTDLAVDELLHRIDTANAWIILRKAERDPEYKALLDACIAEIQDYLGRDLRGVMKLRNAIIFINSPKRVSSYHIDRECSLLLQIRGSKTVYTFDRNDRQILPEDEIERFWSVDNNSATYKPQYQNRATAFELLPGSGVHIPVNMPHWVQNGDAVSVSLNINFHYKDRLLADVYRVNHLLRRLGLTPTPPRRSALLDTVKGTLYSSARSVRSSAWRAGRGK